MASKIYSQCRRMFEDMILEDHPRANILHLKHDGTGTVAAVFEDNGVRWYWAHEFTDDYYTENGRRVHNVVAAYGYKTQETACYMGQRYQAASLWGPYYDEVFTHCGTIWDPKTRTARQVQEA